MDNAYPLIAGLCLSGLMIRSGYELLKRAGKVDAKNPIIFIIVFAGMGLWLACWPVLCPLDPWRLPVPGIVRWLGLGLVAAALVLALAGLWTLRGLENIDHLVTQGVYAKLRHPMYVGFILWIIGWVVSAGAVVSLALGLIFIANILFWRHLEERALESAYGEDYRSYQQTSWF
jgi:protein-S-isoprenylcysteine O-methyltransferase Ste14